MKKKLLSLFLLSFLSFANADECKGFYFQGMGGANWASFPHPKNTEIATNCGYALGGAIGYKFEKILNLEAEVFYLHNNIDKAYLHVDDLYVELPLKGDLSTAAYMGNALFNLPSEIVIPFVGGGFGWMQQKQTLDFSEFHLIDEEGNEVTVDQLRFRKSNVGYQIIAGFNFKICKKLNGIIEYRFVDMISEDSISNNAVTLCFKKIF